jgi:hypothetical protein
MTAPGDWMITLGVTGAAGPVTATPLKLSIDPHRPPDSPTYALSSLALPIVTVIVLLAFLRLRHVELEQWPTGRERAPRNRRQQAHSAVA